MSLGPQQVDFKPVERLASLLENDLKDVRSGHQLHQKILEPHICLVVKKNFLEAMVNKAVIEQAAVLLLAHCNRVCALGDDAISANERWVVLEAVDGLLQNQKGIRKWLALVASGEQPPNAEAWRKMLDEVLFSSAELEAQKVPFLDELEEKATELRKRVALEEERRRAAESGGNDDEGL